MPVLEVLATAPRKHTQPTQPTRTRAHPPEQLRPVLAAPVRGPASRSAAACPASSAALAAAVGPAAGRALTRGRDSTAAAALCWFCQLPLSFGSTGWLQEGFGNIARDEHRHVAYGTWFLQQKCAAGGCASG